jgi:hypothetical protein
MHSRKGREAEPAHLSVRVGALAGVLLEHGGLIIPSCWPNGGLKLAALRPLELRSAAVVGIAFAWAAKGAELIDDVRLEADEALDGLTDC